MDFHLKRQIALTWTKECQKNDRLNYLQNIQETDRLKCSQQKEISWVSCCLHWWPGWSEKYLKFFLTGENNFLNFNFYWESPTQNVLFRLHRYLRKCVQWRIRTSEFLPKMLQFTYGGPPGLGGVLKFSKFPRSCRRGPSRCPTTLQSPSLFYSSKNKEIKTLNF